MPEQRKTTIYLPASLLAWFHWYASTKNKRLNDALVEALQETQAREAKRHPHGPKLADRE